MLVSITRCVEGFQSRRSSDSNLCNRVGGGPFARLNGAVKIVRLVFLFKARMSDEDIKYRWVLLLYGRRMVLRHGRGMVGTASAKCGW